MNIEIALFKEDCKPWKYIQAIHTQFLRSITQILDLTRFFSLCSLSQWSLHKISFKPTLFCHVVYHNYSFLYYDALITYKH